MTAYSPAILSQSVVPATGPRLERFPARDIEGAPRRFWRSEGGPREQVGQVEGRIQQAGRRHRGVRGVPQVHVIPVVHTGDCVSSPTGQALGGQFPQIHHDNGAKKGRRTGDRYKRTVRMFKSAGNHLETTGKINSTLAPSYFLERLLYNAPDSAYQRGFQDTFCSIVNWMNQTNLERPLCQNGQQPLFGGNQEQWAPASAKRLAARLAGLWNNWS